MLDDCWQSLTTAQISQRLKTDSPVAAEKSALVRLDDLCVLNFQGADVRKFLQGYLTCDTSSLDPTHLQPAALCNLKGRVIAFGWCLAPTAEQILWLVPADLLPVLQTFLKPYLTFSKTRLSTLAVDHLLIGRVHAENTGNIAPGLSIELVTSVEQLEALWVHATLLDRAEFDIRLIRAGIPWISGPTSQQFLPQMLGLVSLGAISFDKGCYLGQEVVARAQHRGQVKRQLKKLQQAPGQRPAPGSAIIDARGRNVGSVLQSACSDTVGVTLAVLQNDAEGPFQEQGTGLSLLS